MFNFVAEPVALGTWRSALRSAHIWLFSRPDAAPSKSRKSIQPAQHVAQLSAAEQWDRVSGVLIRSSGQVSQARELQSSGLQQVDLATYAFNNIIDELAAVMALPARREQAIVHLFEPALARSKERGGVAAYKAA